VDVREHVLTCHACGDLASAWRGVVGRLCTACHDRYLRIWETFRHGEQHAVQNAQDSEE
jgi:hypothetical protein